MEWFVVSILNEPISNGTPDFRFRLQRKAALKFVLGV
jgi:hypothetical protein